MDNTELKRIYKYINNIQNFDIIFTKMNFIDKEKFTETLTKLFVDCDIINYTDFNYSNSFMYNIVFETKSLESSTISYGATILISIIAPYGYYYFYEETEKNKKYDKYDYVVRDNPFRDKDCVYIDLIEQFFKSINFKVIDKLFLKEPVSSVTLELKKSNVQVGHCLFDDNDGVY